MVIVFIMTRYWMVLSKLNSLSKEKKEVQEEPIVPTAPRREFTKQRAIFGSLTITIILYISFKPYCEFKNVEQCFFCK